LEGFIIRQWLQAIPGFRLTGITTAEVAQAWRQQSAGTGGAAVGVAVAHNHDFWRRDLVMKKFNPFGASE